MAFAFVQGTDGDVASVAGTTGKAVAFGTNPTPGNVIAACMLTTITSPGTPSFTDTYGSSITLGGAAVTPGAGITMTVKFGVVGSSSGTDTVTGKWTSASSGYIHVAIAEFSGLTGTLTADGQNSAFTICSAGVAFNGATLTTTLTDVLIEYMASSGTGSATSPWSALAATPTGGNASGYQVNVAAGSQQVKFTDTSNGQDPNIIAAFGQTAGAAAVLPELVMAPPFPVARGR